MVSGFQVFRLTLFTIERTQLFTEAELLARDLVELTISKRNEDWNSLIAGQYHFDNDPVEGFVFAPGTETVGEFTRSVTISTVERDGSGNIVASGGTVEADMMLATASVSWQYQGVNFDIQLAQYLSNWRRF
jgi:hypothetical protein